MKDVDKCFRREYYTMCQDPIKNPFDDSCIDPRLPSFDGFGDEDDFLCVYRDEIDKPEEWVYVDYSEWPEYDDDIDWGEDEDLVNNPSHYTDGGIECIEAMEAMLSKEEFIGYLRGNAFKYQWRLRKKWNCSEDLEKAEWYLSKLKEVI